MPRRRTGTLLPLEVGILACGLDMQTLETGFHGFLLATELREFADSESLIGHGTLYKALSRMAKGGLLESEWEDPLIAEAERRPRRKLYRVTPEGATQLAVARAEQPSVSTTAGQPIGGLA